MDSLKLIPSFFFDVIARVVPGAAAIFAFLVLFPGPVRQSWSSLLERYLGSPFTSNDSLLVSTTLFLFAAYVMGQLLSPYAKLVQRISESKLVQRLAIERAKFVRRIGIRLGTIKADSDKADSNKKFEPKSMPNADKGAYDWLRINSKEAGAQCAKIRAEFTMHNGLAVVFFASSVSYAVQTPTGTGGYCSP